MVIECLGIFLRLFKNISPEKYIKITDIIIPDIIENYNEYLPFKVTMDPEKTRKTIEKIKNKNEGQTSGNN